MKPILVFDLDQPTNIVSWSETCSLYIFTKLDQQNSHQRSLLLHFDFPKHQRRLFGFAHDNHRNNLLSYMYSLYI